MKASKRNLKRTKQKMKQVMKNVGGYVKIPSIKHIFEHKNGKAFDYVKQIKEISDLEIVRLKGSIDAYTIPVIIANLSDSIKRYFDKDVLLDFKEVTNVDSSTLVCRETT